MPEPRELLAELSGLVEAATPGLWAWLSPNQCCVNGYCIESDHMGGYPIAHNVDASRADVEFIAAARTAVPRLVAALTAVLDLVDRTDTATYKAFVLGDEIRHIITQELEGGSS